MITDIFAKRYEEVLKFDQHAAEQVIGPTLVQAHHIFFDDVQKRFQFKTSFETSTKSSNENSGW